MTTSRNRGSIGSVLLAAGRGNRLRPLTDAIPKPALPVCDIPIAAWGLTRLLLVARPVAVNMSHLRDDLEAALRPWIEDHDVLPIDEGPEPLGTAGTLASIRDRVEERIVTWNGDLVSDLDLNDLLATHRLRGTVATLAVRRVARGGDFLENDGFVTAPIDRRHATIPGLQFIGAAVYESAALDLIPDGRPAGLGETLLHRLANEAALGVHVHEGYAQDVGTIARYLTACRDVAAGRIAPPLAFDGEVIGAPGGAAYISRSAHVAGEVAGGAVIHRGARTEAGSSVGQAVVMPREIVPADVEVRDCVWFRGAPLRPDPL